MTQDEIIEMARQAGFWKDLFGYPEFKNHLEAFAKLVAAKEREACAMLCEAEWSTVDQQAHSYDLAEAIRARGEA